MVSSTEEADATIHLCAYALCRETATQHCNGCHEAPTAEGGHVDTVSYCSVKCQHADRLFHKNDCKKAEARKSLYRVAETATLAYFRLLERIFDLDVAGLEDAREDTLCIVEGPNPRSILNPFPTEHLQNDQDKQAAMAWMNCGACEDYVQVLVEAMLQDVPFKLTEVHLSKVKYLRRVVVIDRNGRQSDNSTTEHVIFRITINKDEDYALDVTGPQYGFYGDPITPWASYLQTRVEAVGRDRPLEPLRDSHSLPSERFTSDRGWDDLRKVLNSQFAKIFASASEDWQATQNGGFSTMLRLRQAVFPKRQGELLDFIDGRVDARMKQLREAKDPREEAFRGSLF